MAKKKELKYDATLNYTIDKQYKVKLKGKYRGETVSLFLEVYEGYDMKNGKPRPKFTRQSLKKNIVYEPKNQKERNFNKETMTWAEKVRAIKETDLMYQGEGMINPQMQKMDFIVYWENYIANYKKKNISTVKSALRMFKMYVDRDSIPAREIDKKMATGFRDFLIDNAGGQTPRSYFCMFKQVINKGVEDGMFLKSPADKINCSVPTDVRKVIMTREEIAKLLATPCNDKAVEKAFKISLTTGLRHADVLTLKYKHIQEGNIVKEQTKTGNEIVIPLSSQALEIIGEGEDEELVVPHLINIRHAIRTLHVWCKTAGIKKNVTWHSSRHTFATLLLMNGVDVKTVSDMLGHTTLTMTLRYLHAIESKKRDAIDNLNILG